MAGFHTDDDAGWRDAVSVAEGNPTSRAGLRQRKSRNRRMALLLVVLAIPLVTFGLLRATGVQLPDPPSATPSTLLLTVGYLFGGLGFILSVVGIVRLVRAGMWGQAWRGPTLSLNRRDRRQLLERIRHAEPVSAEQYTVAADLARRIATQGPLLLLLGGVVCTAAGQGLTSSVALFRWLFAFVIVIEVIALIYVRRDINKARLWLRQYPTPA